MKALLSALMICAAAATVTVHAEETVKERTEGTANDVVRAGKKVKNKVKQAVCTGTEAECKAKKLKDDAGEVIDAGVDKTKEAVKKVD